MAKARTRKPKAKQAYLPDMEPPSIKVIDQCAENYYDVMQERVALSADEDEKKTALIEKMKEHGLERYEYDGKVVMLTSKSNVKVKKAKQKTEGGVEGEFIEEDEDAE